MMTTYVDGFIVPVPTGKKDAYRAFAVRAAAIFKEHGALRVVECWGDDVPAGKVTDFSRSVQSTPSETVVYSWIEWPTKAVRDAGAKNAMSDPRMQPEPGMFDGKRLIYGGFAVLLDTAADTPKV